MEPVVVSTRAEMAFSGTQQKCKACDKTVYLVEQLTADGVVYHKSCFRCNHCKGTLKVFRVGLCPFRSVRFGSIWIVVVVRIRLFRSVVHGVYCAVLFFSADGRTVERRCLDRFGR